MDVDEGAVPSGHGIIAGTMIDLQLSVFARVRISRVRRLGASKPRAVAERALVANELPRSAELVSLEAFVPRGAHAQYGLLGLRYTPITAEALSVKVSGLEGPNEKWRGALAGLADDVHVGLPDEYAQAVFEGLLEAADGPPGTLEVIEAAHGLAGSSGAFFRRLALAACATLWTADDDLSSPPTIARLRQILLQ